VRQLFQEAVDSAPCIVFIGKLQSLTGPCSLLNTSISPGCLTHICYFTDEIDAIAGKRESAQREMERRIVAQMLTCMDDLASSVAPQSALIEGDALAGQPAADGTAAAETLRPEPGGVAAQPPRGHVVVIGAQIPTHAITTRQPVTPNMS
jgi:ATPase family associated with various cellular activities (AAA)